MPGTKKGDYPSVGVTAVAKAAGVSISTVSRVFNSPEIVNVEVRKKILDLALKMNYRPHPAARALRSRRSHIIGAAIPTLDYAIYARMVNEFEKQLTLVGASTIVISTGFDNRVVFDDVRQLVDRGAEGLLLVGEVENQQLKDYLNNSNIPVVTTYSSTSDRTVPSVGFDNFKATAEALKYMIGLGHTEFAMIAAMTEGNDRQRARTKAYRDTLAAAAVGGADRIYTHGYTMLGGAEVTRQIISSHPEVTAIICNSDVFAIGALSACREQGIRVPEEISIIGCDDFDFAGLLDPPLTTIAVPAAEMGKIAAEKLWTALTSQKPIRSKRMSTELIIRGSTGPPPS